MRGTGQDWVCFAEDALSRLEISSCFLQMFFFREASKAYSGSHRASGSFPAKAHQHLKTFSSVSAAEGSLLQFKKKNPQDDIKSPHYLRPWVLLCLHAPVSAQDMGQAGCRDGAPRDGPSLSRLNGRFKHGRWQWSQLLRARSQPCSAMLETRHGSWLGITQHGNATGHSQQAE